MKKTENRDLLSKFSFATLASQNPVKKGERFNMRNGKSLNLGWWFKDDFKPEYISTTDYSGFEKVNVPHTVKEVPYDCFDQTLTCAISTYIKLINLKKLKNQRAIIEFEGVSAAFDLYINEIKVGSHKGAYSIARFDITNYVDAGSNKVMLIVDSNEREDIPPNGATVDYLLYGGIYRDVTLYITGNTYIEQTMFKYDLNEQIAAVSPELFYVSYQNEYTGQVKVKISGRNGYSHEYIKDITLEKGEHQIVLAPESIPAIECWDLADPNMYDVNVSLWESNVQMDEQEFKVGFRNLKWDVQGIYINGKKVKIIGLNRHQSYPYVGYAMGKRAQEKDAEILKRELGVNTVRCAHYMQSKYFLDKCDELGLLVFEEIPGWGHIGEESFKEVVKNDLDNMVINHFNHPSIVIWGTRLNESSDDDELYMYTHNRCKELDPTRPTSGARWHIGSNLIEDIYSYNDYTPREQGEFLLQEPRAVTKTEADVPYLLSEFVGALLPTRPGDDEMHQEEFALYHAGLMNKVIRNDQYLGAIAWCMCDYNTHNDHNSSTKICSHGVLDMFRVPKWASYMYRSQKNPSEEIVMQPCFMGGRGERSEPVPFFVFTNCEYIDVTLSTDITRRYYPSIKFANLVHPPIEVKENGEFWQDRWRGATIIGYIGGKEAARCTYSDNPRLDQMEAKADNDFLSNENVEETRIVCTFMDENGNRLLYHNNVVEVKTEGEIELIGPSYISVMGGTAAFWVKTKATGTRGNAKVVLKTNRKELGTKTIEIILV